MRIIGGSARGRRIHAPKGRDTRPTLDRVRQSVFDTLGQRCDGLAVLDLFAGSGAMGLEALSRGAASCTFVERAPAALAALRRNLAELGFEDRARVVAGDALRAGALGGPFDLIFADPPYALGALPVLEALAASGSALVHGSRVVVEHPRREVVAERVGPLSRVDARRYGETEVIFHVCEAPRT